MAISKKQQELDARFAAIQSENRVTEAPAPRGTMSSLMDYTGELKTTKKELELANEKLSEFNGALAARLIDTKLIDFSDFANRIESSFATEQFETLKQDIAVTGVNIQAIKVRPTAEGRYEVVYGHRRTMACKALDLPVMAIVEDISDEQLWLQMQEENESRADLSAYEQAKHYQKAIKKGIYKNWSALADRLKKDKSALSRYNALADLPIALIKLFLDPNEIKLKDAVRLSTLRAANEPFFDKVVSSLEGQKLSYNELIECLLPTKLEEKFTQVNFSYGKMSEDAKKVKIEVDKNKLSSEQLAGLKQFLTTFGQN